jgi:hypothetical protein
VIGAVASRASARAQTGRLWRTWERVKPWWTVVGFVAGFLWDSLTLRRIDRLSDNLLLLAYLLVLGLLLVLEIRIAAGRLPRLERHKGWVLWATQFALGGLYSAYVVFYFKSASFGREFLYLTVLAGLMVANQFLAERLEAERMRVALYWLCAFSFLLFFVPVVTGYPGPGLFTIAALGASVLAGLVTLGGWYGHPGLRRSLVTHAGIWAALSLVLATLSWLNVIPPVPFALMDIGVYHDVKRTDEGYALTYESPSWWHPFRHDDRDFHYRPGDRVFCFTAVFAPNGMATQVRHVWDHYDPGSGWVAVDDYTADVKGGRDGGFRTYSAKRHVIPGDWRVRVLTAAGSELAVYRFTVEDGADTPRGEAVVRRYQ